MSLKLGLILLSLIASAQWQDDVQKIDSQIAELEGLQDKLRSRAKRNANDAMRWQFQHDHYMDARRAWDQAAQEKEKIEEIQGHIDKLKTRKQTILKEHGASPNE